MPIRVSLQPVQSFELFLIVSPPLGPNTSKEPLGKKNTALIGVGLLAVGGAADTKGMPK